MNKAREECKILVVDDSRIFREAVAGALAEAPDMKVVETVSSGEEALRYIATHTVDVVTLDVEMPALDGLQTLTRLQKLIADRPPAEQPGVIMVSSSTRKGADITIRALQCGAFDFINKPAGKEPIANQEALQRQLLVTIRCLLSQRKLRSCQPEGTPTKRPATSASPISVKSEGCTRAITTPESCVLPVLSSEMPVCVAPTIAEAAPSAPPARPIRPARLVQAIVIGVSTGGPKALATLIPQLSQFSLPPVLIVQHMPAEFTKSLADSLSRHCSLPVVEAGDGQEAHPGRVYIAPGGRHMTMRKIHNGQLILSVNDQPPENGCRPSVDVLFRSAANALAGRVLAVLLTGMGTDGTRGLSPLKRAGAYSIAQDEESCLVWGMPGSAVRAELIDEVLPLDKIAEAIGEVCC